MTTINVIPRDFPVKQEALKISNSYGFGSSKMARRFLGGHLKNFEEGNNFSRDIRFEIRFIQFLIDSKTGSTSTKNELEL